MFDNITTQKEIKNYKNGKDINKIFKLEKYLKIDGKSYWIDTTLPNRNYKIACKNKILENPKSLIDKINDRKIEFPNYDVYNLDEFIYFIPKDKRMSIKYIRYKNKKIDWKEYIKNKVKEL